MNRQRAKDAVVAEIERRADEIAGLSDHIMRHPETGFREVGTAEIVARELDRMGVPYQVGLALTGVKGRLTGRSSAATVAVIGELDSLIAPGHPFAHPDTHAAHACGHNAQVAAMLGEGMGLRTVMDELDGDVVPFAVPAEECIELEWRLGLRDKGEIEFLVGKPELIRIGAFDDIDMAMMTHTPAWDRPEHASVGDSHNGGIIKYAEFYGRRAHAAGAPWTGVNALQAALVSTGAINAQRDTFEDEDYVRVHRVMADGSRVPNAVPERARLEGRVRGRTLEAIDDANAKTDRSLRAGALALGARVEITTLSGYFPNRQDPTMVRLARANCAAVVGERHMGSASHRAGCADLGDVSAIMPVIHPHSGGVTGGSTHSTGYHVVDHRLAAVNPAKWMAMTVVDLLSDGAAEALAVKESAGPRLTRDEYVARRRGFDTHELYDGLGEGIIR